MKRIYIVFSATPYLMGTFIRAVTGSEYNHVSVALDPELNEVYSFARLKRGIPLCGGFVREGRERFNNERGVSSISVIEIMIDDDASEAVNERLRLMLCERERYVYNMASALCDPIGVKVRLRDSYTCSEFAVSILRTAGLPIGDGYHSIPELFLFLSHAGRVIFHGEFPATAAVADETFEEKIPAAEAAAMTFRQLLRMASRTVK